MELSDVFEAKFWQGLLSDLDRGQMFVTSNAVRFATVNLPKLAALLERDYPDTSEFDSDNVPISYKDKALIKLILGEEGSQFSSAERLILALSSLQGLYDVINETNGVQEEKLLVLGIDSGSDKQFDILGIAAAIADTKDLILTLFDRLVFKKHSQSSKTIEIIAQSLPVFEKIGELETNGHVGPEQSALLKRKLFASLQGFVDSGAMIPEMDDALVVEPRIVMQPQPKLLMAPQGVGHGAAQSYTDESKSTLNREEESKEGLSLEEVENLEILLRKAGYVSESASTPKSKPARPRVRPPRKT